MIKRMKLFFGNIFGKVIKFLIKLKDLIIGNPIVSKVLSILKYLLIVPLIDELFISRLKHKTQRKVWGIVFLTPWILGFLLFFLKPLVESFYFSFFDVRPSKDGLVMVFKGLERYKYALRGHVSFANTLLGSLSDTAINLPVIIIFSLLLAVILNTKFKGRTFARAIFFIPVIFNSSAITSALGGGENLRNLMEQNGMGIMGAFDFEGFLMEANMAGFLITFLIGSIARIYSILSLSGVQILIFLAGIQSIPFHLYEAAKIEGATTYETFWKITLPMVSPMIVTASVFTIIDSFLRSPVTDVMQAVFNKQDYGLNAAMSWIYFGVSGLLLAIVLGFLSKVVFYYDK